MHTQRSETLAIKSYLRYIIICAQILVTSMRMQTFVTSYYYAPQGSVNNGFKFQVVLLKF